MRRPGGAVRPAMKAVTRFDMFAAMKRRSLLFGIAANLADHDHFRRLRIVLEQARTSMKSMPLIGSPPMPTQVDWPIPRWVSA
jgi:hypothetical protein